MILISLKIDVLRQIHRGVLKEAASVDSNISFLFPPLSSWQLPLFPDPLLLWEYTKMKIPVLTHPPKIGREMSLFWRKKRRGHACPENLQISELHPPSSWEDPFRYWIFLCFPKPGNDLELEGTAWTETQLFGAGQLLFLAEIKWVLKVHKPLFLVVPTGEKKKIFMTIFIFGGCFGLIALSSPCVRT